MFFFFFKQKTAYEMCGRDWSSDVCSSDLAKTRCPAGVVPACHNASDTVTISGPAAEVKDFVKQLKDEGYFAKEVASNGVAYHSYYMAAIAPKLKQCLQQVSFTGPSSYLLLHLILVLLLSCC